MANTMSDKWVGSEERRIVLDHGYVQLVECWGSDERIVEAARMSTSKGFQGWGPVKCSCGGIQGCKRCDGTGWHAGDEKLLRFLWENAHHTPFEMAGLTIEVQAPIFVFREWHRHRTQSYNELSARYTPLPDLFYVPSLERLMAAKQSTANKQSSEQGFTPTQALVIQGALLSSYEKSREAYDQMLASGVAREVARMVIPVAQYSRMRASANLRNWLLFLALRLPRNAQWEIRQYADVVSGIVLNQFPRTWGLFSDGLPQEAE